MPIQARIERTLLLADAAWRLGPRALSHYGRHRLAVISGASARRLAEAAVPRGPFLPPRSIPAAPAMPAEWCGAARQYLGALPPPGLAGPFPSAAPALGMDLFRPGDIRPVWEANRFANLPLRAQAARLWPMEGHGAALEAWLSGWLAANPPFLGPNWACGQEAALRALHLALALALLGQDHAPSPGARSVLSLHARRIRATAHYARAQDNNHSISEPAGLFACALLLGDAGARHAAAAELSRAMARLVAPDGGFAQVSTGYHRLLLDVLSTVEWLRRRHGAPPFPAPFAERAEAAARWLARLTAKNGATPRLGHQDGSAFADLSLAGPADARGSVERAMRLFAGASAGFADDPGCAWLSLPPAPPAPSPPRWRAAGSMGWEEAGARALLRTGPLRFRPGQADLLHFELWDGEAPILIDAGTGAYNPPSADRWWLDYFPSATAHNTITFDGREPMPRASRFLHARWPRLSPLPDGAALRTAHGYVHRRRVMPEGRLWRVEDEVAGPFTSLAIRWRLGPGAWRATAEGAEGPASLSIQADAPFTMTLEQGWESPAYGEVRPCTVLVAHAVAPIRRIETRIGLR